MKKKYTHLFFDLDNTLWDFSKNSKLAMQTTFNHFKLVEKDIDFNRFFEVYEKINHALWASYRKKEVSKKELIRRRFEDTFSELKIIGIDPNEINTFYLNEMPNQKTLYPGVIETLEYLKTKRYQLNIITNGFTEVQNKKLKSSGLRPFFNKVFTSEEVKTPKPGREIFEHAIKSVNAKKINSLMIGDDWDVDILGAAKFGIDVVYIGNDTHSYVESKNVIYSFESVNKLQLIL
jgi:putative hydrolase of the HAD superfamily